MIGGVIYFKYIFSTVVICRLTLLPYLVTPSKRNKCTYSPFFAFKSVLCRRASVFLYFQVTIAMCDQRKLKQEAIHLLTSPANMTWTSERSTHHYGEGSGASLDASSNPAFTHRYLGRESRISRPALEMDQCVGCIDSTNFPIRWPTRNNNVFICHKGFYSLNVLVS